MEKHLIILSIIIIIIVIYCLFCNQKDNKETFSSTTACNADITTLANLARDLQSTTNDPELRGTLNLKNRHILSSDNDGYLRLKSYSTQNVSGGANADAVASADIAVRNLNVDGNFNLLPRGIIVAWNNSVAPIGWALCDGTLGTPDLRNKFIFGEPLNANPERKTGGQENVSLNINQIPSHSHKYWSPNTGSKVGDQDDRQDVYYSTGWIDTLPTGNNKQFNNLPPYYVLAYIMKL